MAKNKSISNSKLYPSWLLTATMAIVLFITLASDYIFNQQDYLYILHSHTLYADNEPFFDEIKGNSAWLMILAGRYITQFFINPSFPSWFIPCICIVQTLLLDYLLQIRKRRYGHFLLCLLTLPSILAFLSGQNYDYVIYDRLDSSTYIILFLGQLVAVALFTLTKIKNYGAYISIVLSALLYPFIGIFSLTAIAMTLFLSITKKDRYEIITSSAALIQLFILMATVGSNFFNEYWYISVISPLVNNFFGTTFWYALASLVALALLPLLCLIKENETNGTMLTPIFISLACTALVSFLPTKYLTYRDSNFYAELKAKRLLDKYEWKKLYNLTSKVKHPTPTIIAYQEIATMAMEKMISQSFDLEPTYYYYNTNHFATEHFIHYADLAYYAGMPNVSLFYAMETKQLSSNDFGVIKLMQESAMLNREYELAKKYQDILSTSSVYKEYAEKWRGYITDTARMYKELPHLKHIERLMDPTPALYSAASIQEIIMHRDQLDNGMTLILRLYCDLYERDLERFSQDIVAAGNYFSRRSVPKPIQEACVLCDLAGDPNPVKAIKINPEIGNMTFTMVQNINGVKNPAKAIKKYYTQYKGSYTYYYLLSSTDDSMYKGELEPEKQ